MAHTDINRSRVPEGRLFSSPHNRLGFKIKSLFRSKESLAAEMKRVLENTSSRLEAFLIQGNYIIPVPHSDFHGLEATHMRTILSQLNDNSWFETFSNMTVTEKYKLDTAIHSTGQGNLRREVVALRVLQENKNSAWMRLLAGKLHTPDLPQHYNHRLILAILRGPLVDGERKVSVPHGTIPIENLGRISLPPSPPPQAMLSNIRPPPTTATPTFLSGTRLVDPDGPRLPPRKYPAMRIMINADFGS